MMLHPLKMPPGQARKVVSYRARRFLPSVAGLLGLSDKEAASVGNWKGAGDSAGQRLSISATMRVRYDDTKLQTAARAKAGLVTALKHASSEADSFDIHWDKLKLSFPSWKWASEQAKHAGAGVTEFLPRRTATGDVGEFPLKPSYMKALPIKKGDLSSSSSGSSSLDQEETSFDRAQEEAIAAISWAAPSHKKGLIHAVKAHNRQASNVCAEWSSNLRNTRSETGLRSSLLLPISWHTVCLNRLPEYFQVLVDL